MDRDYLAKIAVLRNWDRYYKNRWDRYNAGTLGFDWNFAAFFFGWFWFFYRKIWWGLLGAWALAIILLLPAGRQYSGLLVAGVVLRFVYAILANRVYFFFIKRTIQSAERLNASTQAAVEAMKKHHQSLRENRIG